MVYLTIAFSLWMLIDAIKRSAPGYWILIVVFFFPFGAPIYFFVIKFRDYRPLLARLASQQLTSRGRAPSRAASIDELMARYEASPSRANQRILAEAFYESSRFEQAASLFSDILEGAPDDLDAAWGLARVRRSQEKHSEALHLYEQVIEAAPKHGDFTVALEYAETLWDAGQAHRALEVLEDIAEESKRLNHRLAFAHYLVLAGEKTRARSLLKRALHEHETHPGWIKQKERQWANAASDLLRKLDSA